jgi:hypothetical protein
MTPIEIVILIAAVALVAFTVIYNINKRKKGKIGCDCGGSDCGSCSGCGTKDNSDAESETENKENCPFCSSENDSDAENETENGIENGIENKENCPCCSSENETDGKD